MRRYVLVGVLPVCCVRPGSARLRGEWRSCGISVKVKVLQPCFQGMCEQVTVQLHTDQDTVFASDVVDAELGSHGGSSLDSPPGYPDGGRSGFGQWPAPAGLPSSHASSSVRAVLGCDPTANGRQWLMFTSASTSLCHIVPVSCQDTVFLLTCMAPCGGACRQAFAGRHEHCPVSCHAAKLRRHSRDATAWSVLSRACPEQGQPRPSATPHP
ncbi:hypothetical protein HaLaN_25750 [Haematococcus lacustris]|uniref:Uncharacterized protein n=1 Tax=Haematococcus lacustris TaxID=44745 RepID=A0A699ZY77_HAELA|nr:hypothetical protein HaLaN_25750 [Haematococcus lacustris]